MKIKAAVSRQGESAFTIENIILDAPRENEILVRIAGAGICHSDLLAHEMLLPLPQPAVLGHEGSGVVEAVGSAIKSVKPGDHVVLTFAHCGSCRRCDNHDPACCAQFPVLNFSGGRADGSKALHGTDGEAISSHFFAQSSFGSMALAYESNVIPIDRDVPIELMGPLGCGVQTGAGAIMNTLACASGSSLLILGGGSLGLSAVLAAVVQRCGTIIVSEPHAARRALAIELGATHVIDPAAQDVTTAVRAIVPQGVDYAFDTTGVAKVAGAALAAMGVRGKLVIAGVPLDPASELGVPILPMVSMGQAVIGMVAGDSEPADFIPRLVALYRAGQFPFDRLITRYPLDQINQAVADHGSGRCVKAVLIP